MACAAPTYQQLLSAISTVSAWVWKRSTTSSPPSMIPPTTKPTPGRSGWNGRASRFRAGPTAWQRTRRKCLPGLRHGVGSLWPCLNLRSPSLASHKVRCARNSHRCRSRHHQRTEHDGRGFLGNGQLGTLRNGGCFMPGQGRAWNRLYIRTNGRLWVKPCPPSARSPSIST